MEDEFDWIAKVLSPLTQGRPESAGLKNDGALLPDIQTSSYIVTTDTLISGTHFLPQTPLDLLARKSLRVNLSDLAAMGAQPVCYTLNLSLPKEMSCEDLWNFASGLEKDQKEYGLFLLGGDTTRSLESDYPLTISITAFGQNIHSRSWSRDGAKEGDYCIVTGSAGYAYLGLKILLKEIKAPPSKIKNTLVKAYECPAPPVRLPGLVSEESVHAAIDISDGLLADLGHICKASNLKLNIQLSDLPVSREVATFCHEQNIALANLAAGGDDYQLALAIAPKFYEGVRRDLSDAGIETTTVGRFERCGDSSHASVRLYDDQSKQDVTPHQKGWLHMQNGKKN